MQEDTQQAAATPEGRGELIPEPALRRLPWYLSYVRQLRGQGVDYVSSTQISRDLNVEAPLISKDLSLLGLRGKTRIGYDTASLEQRLHQVLGFGRQHKAVVVGVGSLGRALMLDQGLERYGLQVVAGFDVDPARLGSDAALRSLPVYHVDTLVQRLPLLGATIGVLTVPADQAQGEADRLARAGVGAIWNFTPRRVTVPQGVVIANTSIYAQLAVMYNRLNG